MSAKRKVRARKMWANFYDDGVPMLHATLEKARDAGKHAMNRQPMYVLPADAKSYDALMELGAKASCIEWGDNWQEMSDQWRQSAISFLAAIGIHRPPTKEQSK